MKKIRLIELFAGIGSQASALERLGVDFEHYRVVEYDKYPIASYNAIHNTNFEPQSITDIHGKDLGIIDTDSFTYLLTYLLISLSRFECCRTATWNGKGKWNKVWIVMGSRKIIE